MALASSRALGHPAANGLGPEIARGPSSVYGRAVAPPATTQLAAKTTTTRAANRKFIAASFVTRRARAGIPNLHRWRRLVWATSGQRSLARCQSTTLTASARAHHGDTRATLRPARAYRRP